jgi:methylmalonyl-CoA/ethylmalonyl-CoA epimerase
MAELNQLLILEPREHRMNGTPMSAPMPVHGLLTGLLLRVDHVGFAVADLDAAITFWEGIGLECRHRETNEEQGVSEAMLSVGEAETRVQLLAPSRPDSPIATYLDRSGPGIQQVAFTVTDVERAAAAVRAAGMRVLYESPKRGTAGSRINFIHPKDCGGVLVELVEPVVGNHP